MVTKTNEQALEACIEKVLTGTCREQLKLEGVGVAEANAQYRSGHLYWLGEAGATRTIHVSIQRLFTIAGRAFMTDPQNRAVSVHGYAHEGTKT